MTEPHHRKHRSGSKERKAGLKKAEKYIIEHLFWILGIVFFIAGSAFLFRQMKPQQSLISTLLSFFTSGGAEQGAGTIIFSFNGWKVLIQLLPGLGILALPFFLYKRYPYFARISALTGTFWVLAVHIKVLSLDFIATSTCYPTLLVAMIVTFALCLVPLWHAYKMKSSSLQLLVVILFYFSLLFITNNYQWHYYPDFLFMLLFTGLVLFISISTGKLAPFYLQAFLAIMLVAVFWVRRIMMRDSADLVSTYFIISSVFYCTFFISGLLLNLSKRTVIFELAATLLMLVNTLFYWGSMIYILQKYGHADLQGLFTMALALFNGTLLYFSPKFNPALFRNPYVFMTLFLFSMILPFWAQQNYIILSASLFSVLLLLYSKSAKNLTALVASIGLVAVMSGMFLYKWIIIWFPGLYAGAFPDDRTLFYTGFQAGLFTLFALYFNHKLIKNLEKSLPGNWFSRRTYRRILNIFFLVVLYMSGFWCWHFLYSMLFPVAEAMLLSWFSFTCLFLIFLIPVLVKQKSSLLMPVVVVTALTLLSYPMLVNFSVVAVRDKGLMNGGLYSSCFILHFFLLPVMIGLMVYLYYHLKRIWVNKRYRMLGLRIFVTGLFLSLILMEYDHFTIFFGYSGYARISEKVAQNHHLPWSVILLVFSLLLIAWGVIRKHRSVPQISFVLLFATVAKILVYDFAFLGDSGKIVVLFILGGFMIAFSFFYSRFRKVVLERKAKKYSDEV